MAAHCTQANCTGPNNDIITEPLRGGGLRKAKDTDRLKGLSNDFLNSREGASGTPTATSSSGTIRR